VDFEVWRQRHFHLATLAAGTKRLLVVIHEVVRWWGILLRETPVENLVQVLVVAKVEAGLVERVTTCQHDLVQTHYVLKQQPVSQ
jgi:hypothetical protein